MRPPDFVPGCADLEQALDVLAVDYPVPVVVQAFGEDLLVFGV